MSRTGRDGGVYCDRQIIEALQKGHIKSSDSGDFPIETEKQVQPASIDLRLGKTAYRVISSFLPEESTVEEALHDRSDLKMYKFDLDDEDGAILERGQVYLVPLLEVLDLEEGVTGRTNPKSTTGRLDIFTRVITDNNPRFDEIESGYSGQLYVEIMPRSFTIKVKTGQSLVQLRLRRGNPGVDDSNLHDLHREGSLIFDDENSKEPIISDGIFMSIDLEGELVGEESKKIVGYKTKKNSHVVELANVKGHAIEDYWEPVFSNKEKTLILEPEEFYILASKERICIPPEYASEMVAYEGGTGELRTHYAGFFDPGFGHGKEEVKGTKAVLEVRAHDVPFMLKDGQTVCKLEFEHMLERPEKPYGPKIGSSYQHQTITLSKQFK